MHISISGISCCARMIRHQSKGGQIQSNFDTQSWRTTVTVQPLHVMVRNCVGCVAGLHAIVTRQSCFVSVHL